MADELIVPPGYPKISTLWDCIVETEAMIDATARAAAEHFRQRRSWRVRLHRRLRWWAVLLGLAPFAPAKSNYFPFTPDITPKQIRKLPFFEGLAIAMVITDLVIREELVIWLNKKQPRAKRISVALDDWDGTRHDVSSVPPAGA